MAIAGELLTGKVLWSSTGTKISGSMADRGTWDLTTGFPGAGYFAGVSSAPGAGTICDGTSILGVDGDGICQSGTVTNLGTAGDLVTGKQLWDEDGNLVTGTYVWNMELHPSTALRDANSTPITIGAEKQASALPANYREVPDVMKDDDGYDATSPMNAHKQASLGVLVCGTSGSISARIADCNTTWDGTAKGMGGETIWKLVARTYVNPNYYEVWVDTATGLLWSDNLGVAGNWCRATGNTQNAGSYDCATNNAAIQSFCAEFAGATSPTTEDYANASPSYRAEKGGMGAKSAAGERVYWRVPSKSDWELANVHGVRFVLPNMLFNFWSTAVVSDTRNLAWNFYGSIGSWVSVSRGSGTRSVRCVGRAAW